MVDLEEIRKRLDDATNDTGIAWAWESCGEKGDGSNIVGTMFHPDDHNAMRPLLGRCDPIYDEDSHSFREYYRDEEVAEIEHRNRSSGATAEFISRAPTDISNLLDEVERLRLIESCAKELIAHGLQLRGDPSALTVVEKKDKSDPHHRLCTMLED